MNKNSTLKAVALALLACLIWASTYVLSRTIANSTTPIEISFWRWVVAIIIIFPFAKPHLKTEFAKIRNNLRLYFYLGLLAACIYNVLFFKAAHYTNANNLAILSTSSFLWTLILAAFLKIEKLTKIKLISCLVSFVGVIEVVSKGSLINVINLNLNFGDILMLVACLCWGIYGVLLKKTVKDLNQIFLIFIIALIGFACLLPLFILQTAIVGFSPFNFTNIFTYLYVGIFVSAVAWYCYNSCVNIIGPINTSMIFFLLPVFGAIMSYLIIDEKLYSFHAIGFVLIITGILISNYKEILKKNSK
jgi:drug/metabolite transporter (DMT)-like permease